MVGLVILGRAQQALGLCRHQVHQLSFRLTLTGQEKSHGHQPAPALRVEHVEQPRALADNRARTGALPFPFGHVRDPVVVGKAATCCDRGVASDAPGSASPSPSGSCLRACAGRPDTRPLQLPASARRAHCCPARRALQIASQPSFTDHRRNLPVRTEQQRAHIHRAILAHDHRHGYVFADSD